MKTGIGKTERQLLSTLMDGDFHSARELAHTVGVSSKTVRTKLAAVQTVLLEHGVEIISNTGMGYQLVCQDRSFLDGLFSTENSFEGFRNTVANADRAVILLYYILSCDRSITTEELAESFYVSVSTIKKNLIYIRGILNRFDLQLVSRRKEGLRVEGREHDIRMCINYILNFQRKFSGEDDTEGMASELDPTTTREVEKVIYKHISHERRFTCSFQSIHFLAKLIRISLLRNKSGHRLEEYDPVTVNLFSSRDSFVIARRILKDCAELLKGEFTAEDELMMSICLVAVRVIVRIDSTYESNYLQAKNYAYELVEYLAEVNHTESLIRDTTLVEDIAVRMEGIRTRATYNICQGNITGFFGQPPLFARKNALQSVLYLQKHYDIRVCSDNIDILTILFHQRHSSQRVLLPGFNCCVATLYDYRFAQEYAGELKAQLYGLAERMDVIDVTGRNAADLEGYDVIFTFRPLIGRFIFPEGKPLLAIDSLYPEDAAASFREWCMREVLHVDTARFIDSIPVKSMQCRDQKQCLMKIAEDICPENDISVGEDLLAMNGTSPFEAQDNVVFITGSVPHCNNITVRLYVLNKPVIWGEKENKAQLVIYWDAGKQSEERAYFSNEFLTRLLQQIFRNKRLVSRIITTCSTDEMTAVAASMQQEVWKNIYRHSER